MTVDGDVGGGGVKEGWIEELHMYTPVLYSDTIQHLM